jgi:hypothetical protein
MKAIYVVCTYEQDGKRYAIPDKIHTGVNLAAALNRHNLTCCHLCESRMQAEQIAKYWNDSYIANGTSVYASV